MIILTTLNPYLKGNITLLEDELPVENDKEFEALISAIKELTFKILKTLGEPTRELSFALRNIDNSYYLINFLCSNIPIVAQQKQELLNIGSLKQRAFSLYASLSKEAQLIQIKADIQSKTREDINQQQREHFLQQQIKTIQDELGGSVQEQDILELREKAANKKWDEKVGAVFEKEVKKLERLHPQSPDFSVQYNYLETFVDLPWGDILKIILISNMLRNNWIKIIMV